MKGVFFVLAVVFGLYYGYNHFHNPTQISDPVYGELRIDVESESRRINLLMFAKMADEADCRERSERVWKKVLDCKECAIQLLDCRLTLPARYEQLFDDVPINITYLSLTRGSRFERDARMVIWGVTGNEGKDMCEVLKAGIRARYAGTLQCVDAR